MVVGVLGADTQSVMITVKDRRLRLNLVRAYGQEGLSSHNSRQIMPQGLIHPDGDGVAWNQIPFHQVGA